MKYHKTLILLFLISFKISFSQNNTNQLTKNEKIETVNAVGKVIIENYIFPEIADKIAHLIYDKLKKGEYNSIKDPKEFASKLTKDVQSLNGDKHLRVFYEPKNNAPQKMDISEEDRKNSEEKMKEMERRDNYTFKEVNVLDGNIGYINLRGFRDPEFASETALSAISFLKNTDAIIFDLRNNGGGYPQMVQLISSYFFEGDPVHLNSFYTRKENKTKQFWTLPYVPGKRLPNVQLYILTSSSTFSAAEEFAYNLKHLNRAVIVGENTGGGAHPGGSIYATDYYKVWTPTGRAINPITNTNWEGIGVIPHIKTSKKDALLAARLKALDSLKSVNKNSLQNDFYDWHIGTLKAIQTPLKVSLSLLNSYVGTYGDLTISLENDVLFYQRGSASKLKLTPIDNTSFQYGELTDVRIVFLKIKDKVNALMTKNVYGRSDTYKKNKK